MKTAIDVIVECMSEEDIEKYRAVLNEAHRKNFSDIRAAYVHACKYDGPLARKMADEYYSKFFGEMNFFKF